MRINAMLAEWHKKVSGESSKNPLRGVTLAPGADTKTTKSFGSCPAAECPHLPGFLQWMSPGIRPPARCAIEEG